MESTPQVNDELELDDFVIEVTVPVTKTFEYYGRLTVEAASRKEALEKLANCKDLSNAVYEGWIAEDATLETEDTLYSEISILDLDGNSPNSIDGKPVARSRQEHAIKVKTLPENYSLKDPVQMAKDHPDTWDSPPAELVALACPGTVVKIAIDATPGPGERFWFEVLEHDGTRLTLRLANVPVALTNLGYGDVIAAEDRHVCGVGLSPDIVRVLAWFAGRKKVSL